MKTWRERIEEAAGRRAFLGLVRRPRFNGEDRADAGDWDFCAVGEQSAAMPNVILWSTEAKEPSDAALAALGYRFDAAVAANDVRLAARLLDIIEDRALQLKREADV